MPPPLDLRPLGQRIVHTRRAKGFTQQQLAFHAEIALRTLTLLETGRARDMTLSTLAAIARVLEVTLDYLVFGAE